MTEGIDHRQWNQWWLLLCPAVAAIGFFLAVIAQKAFDLEIVIYTFLGVPILSLVFALIILFWTPVTKRTPKKIYFVMFPVYWAITAILFVNLNEIRLRTLWLLHAHELKAQIQMQPVPKNGELRHVEFDGWGWAGMDSVEYLVFDANDSLATASASHSLGRFPGIPCEVPLVKRMASKWYVVLYYTNAEWDRCT